MANIKKDQTKLFFVAIDNLVLVGRPLFVCVIFSSSIVFVVFLSGYWSGYYMGGGVGT